jgi:hypothetical protein
MLAAPPASSRKHLAVSAQALGGGEVLLRVVDVDSAAELRAAVAGAYGPSVAAATRVFYGVGHLADRLAADARRRRWPVSGAARWPAVAAAAVGGAGGVSRLVLRAPAPAPAPELPAASEPERARAHARLKAADLAALVATRLDEITQDTVRQHKTVSALDPDDLANACSEALRNLGAAPCRTGGPSPQGMLGVACTCVPGLEPGDCLDAFAATISAATADAGRPCAGAKAAELGRPCAGAVVLAVQLLHSQHPAGWYHGTSSSPKFAVCAP